MVRKTCAAVVCLAVLAAGCSDDSPSSPNPPGPGTVTFNVAMFVRALQGQGVPFASVLIVDGQSAGQTFTTDGNGRITLTGAQGNMNVEASSPGCASARGGVGPPATSGATQPLTITIQTPQVWTRSRTGDTVLNMPRCIERVRINASFGGRCQNFVVRIDGDLIVNEILGTCSVASAPTFTGTFLTSGGTVATTISTGIAWTLTEIR